MARCCPVIPVRFLVVVCLCLAAIATNDLLSTIIVTMVRQPSHALPVQTNDSSMPICPTGSQDVANKSKGSPWDGYRVVTRTTLFSPFLPLDQVAANADGFDWSLETQGIILGSYYWLFALVLLPVGYAADHGHGSFLISISLLLTGLLLVASPIAAHTSASLLVSVRVALGACNAIRGPCSYVLLCNWSPASERSILLTIVINISSVSSIVFLLLTGAIVQRFTWTGMFYVPGSLCILSFLLVAPVLRNQPESHYLVTRDELAYIRAPPDPAQGSEDQNRLIEDETNDQSNAGPDSASTDPVPVTGISVPWIRILTNPSVLSVILFKFSYSLACAVLTAESPTLLTSVFQMPVGEVGQVLATCSALYMVSALIMAKLSEELISRSLMTRTSCRKLFSLLTGTGAAVTACLIPVFGCRVEAVVGMILLNNVMQSATVASDMTLPAEMTNRFPGLLFSICTVSSVLAYLTGPTMAGAMLQLVPDRWTAWLLMFASTSGLLILANLLFLVFASAEPQSFDTAVIRPQQQLASPSSAKSLTAGSSLEEPPHSLSV